MILSPDDPFNDSFQRIRCKNYNQTESSSVMILCPIPVIARPQSRYAGMIIKPVLVSQVSSSCLLASVDDFRVDLFKAPHNGRGEINTD